MPQAPVLSPIEVLGRIRRARREGELRPLSHELESRGYGLDDFFSIARTSQGHVECESADESPRAYLIRGLLPDGRRAVAVVAFLSSGSPLVADIVEY